MASLKKSLMEVNRVDSHVGQEGRNLEVRFVDEKKIPNIFFDKVKNYIENFTVKSLFAFKSNKPFTMHTDSGLKTDTIPYKNLTFCLEENHFQEHLVLFNARGYFSVSITDFKNFLYSKEVVENYNYLLATPEDFIKSLNAVISNDLAKSLSTEEKNKLLNHIPEELHSHFSVIDVIEFKYNRLIIFDSCQLHSGSSKVPVKLAENLKRMIVFTEANQ